MASTAIETDGLTKTFGTGTDDEVRALRGVDLAVPEGQIFGYLGRNGQGKSTTVRILTGLSIPTAGRAVVGGYDVVADRAKVQAVIGVTLQDVALDVLQSGREHLVLVASLWGFGRRNARRRADELLEEFDLTDAADRLIRDYSGGMRRRLDLATSLLGDPSILFLDEPTTGLDPQSRRALWSRIRRLSAGGSTVFLTTQYLEEADELADELAIVDGGQIVAQGTPESIRSAHGSTRVAVRVSDPSRRSKVAFELGHRFTEDGEWLRSELPTSSEGAALLARLVATGQSADEVEIRNATLEDAFLDLTSSDTVGPGPAASDQLVGVAA